MPRTIIRITISPDEEGRPKAKTEIEYEKATKHLTTSQRAKLRDLLAEISDDKFNDWERRFIQDISGRADRGELFTTAQVEKLQETWRFKRQ